MVSIARLSLMLVLAALPAVLTSTGADSDFSVSSTSTESVDSSTENVSFVKQWTLSTTSTHNDNDDDDDSDDDSNNDSSDDGDDKIDSIKLQLPGRVFISYVGSLPSGVLGYVNVSGDSQTVVETVKVNSDDDDEELEVKYDSSSQSTGYLLTEIFLATSNIVTDVEIESTAVVVIEDGVLVHSNTDEELQIKASDSSVVYVASSAMSLQDLKLELSDSATLQLTTDSITVREDGQFQAHDKSIITVLTSSLTVDDLDFDAERSGTICISASKITASSYDGKDASKISLPNASSKYTATGSLSCDEVSTPSRMPGCVFSSACSTSTTTPSLTTTTSSSTSTSAPSSTATSSSSGVKTSEQTSAAASSFNLLAIIGAAITTGLLVAGM